MPEMKDQDLIPLVQAAWLTGTPWNHLVQYIYQDLHYSLRIGQVHFIVRYMQVMDRELQIRASK